MSLTAIESQVKILSEVWVDYRDEEAFEGLFEYADIAFPLAFAIDYGIVELTDKASAHVREAFGLLIQTLNAEDKEYDSFADILLETDEVSDKDQDDR
jgi:hypothetical protein